VEWHLNLLNKICHGLEAQAQKAQEPRFGNEKAIFLAITDIMIKLFLVIYLFILTILNI
jgi:hypothetical protein